MSVQKPVVTLATAPGCPHCPGMKQLLQQLDERGLLGRLDIIDISSTPEFATTHGIRSVPWLQIGDLTFTGKHTLGELEYWVQQASSEGGILTYITQQLEAGRLNDVDALLNKHSDWLGKVIPLIADMEAPIQARIGLSALIESEHDQSKLQIIEPMLIAYSQHRDKRVRGDACHLLANIHSDRTKQALHAALQDPEAEVREIAEESLALLANSSID